MRKQSLVADPRWSEQMIKLRLLHFSIRANPSLDSGTPDAKADHFRLFWPRAANPIAVAPNLESLGACIQQIYTEQMNVHRDTDDMRTPVLPIFPLPPACVE